MDRATQTPAGDAEAVVQTYGDGLYRLCLVMLGNDADAEDAVQETVMKYLQRAPAFTDAEYERAWLITVAKNQCRDMLRARRRRPQVSLEQMDAQAESAAFDRTDSGVWQALMALPERFRLVLTLYYAEQYRIEDIARIIHRTPSAVKMRLQKGRKLLGEIYRKEYM